MSAVICRQPNGLLCRFSTIVDTVIHYNMTDEDYIEMCAENARIEAREMLDRKLHSFNDMISYFRPNCDDVAVFNEKLKEMGSDIQLNPTDYE